MVASFWARCESSECHGAMIRLIALWCRRGLLAYVYNGVSLTTTSEVKCLSGGKVALI